MKYTKTDHMRFLNEHPEKALDPEAKRLMLGVYPKAKKPHSADCPGQWLQTKDREAFNRDYDAFCSTPLKNPN